MCCNGYQCSSPPRQRSGRGSLLPKISCKRVQFSNRTIRGDSESSTDFWLMPLPWDLRLKFPFLSICYSKGVTTGKVPHKTVRLWCSAGLPMDSQPANPVAPSFFELFGSTPNAQWRKAICMGISNSELLIYSRWASWPLTAACFLSGLILSQRSCVVGLMRAVYSGVVQASMCLLLSNQPGLWPIKEQDEAAWIIACLTQPSCDCDVGPRLSCLQWLHQSSLSSQGAELLSHLPKIFLYIH